MKDRLTKKAGRNATYRGERILEIIDKLTDIENKEQSCLDVIPPDYQERTTLGTLNGKSSLAKTNNKLFLLENAIEAGALVSVEWHNEQLGQLQEQLLQYEQKAELGLLINVPVKPGTLLHFIQTHQNDIPLDFTYNIISSDKWIYVIDSYGNVKIEESDYECKFEYTYDYNFGENVFSDKEKALEALSKLVRSKNDNT